MDQQLQHVILGAFLFNLTKDLYEESEWTQATRAFVDSGLGDFGLREIEREENRAAQLALLSNNPSTSLQNIIAQADRLASGLNREKEAEKFRIPKNERLVPLRYLLRLNDETPPNPYPKFPLKELTSRNASCNPAFDGQQIEREYSSYKAIWDDFLNDWNARRSVGFDANLAFLSSLFERYFWCVPAPIENDIRDVSLFDHSRMTAAVAACLYSYHQSDLSNAASILDMQQEKFLLVCGDLSGIQNYIFAIAHAGGGKVAKRLRARSFYLSRITQVLSHQIVDSIDFPLGNIIINAGGKFHLLLPNSEQVIQILSETEIQSQKWLQDKFQGQLSLNLTWISGVGNDFCEGRIGEKFSEISRSLEIKKYHSLGQILIDEGGWVENDFVLPKAITKEESFSGQYDLPSPIDEETLGRQLTNARCMAIYPSLIGDYSVFNNWSFSVADKSDRLAKEARCLVSFQRGVEDNYPDPLIPVNYEYRASYVPTDKGRIVPFDRMAESSKGRKSIAYFKADVDNLGLIFSKGMEWHSNSWNLSRITAFSRSLEFFFSGRIENILSNDSKMIYTVFSGGDDVLLVGSWNTIHDFARDLQKEWFAFTGKNKHLTLSAGITMNRPLMPVWAAADTAEAALEKAKLESFKPDVQPKDQCCSLEHIIKWDDMDDIFSDIERLNEWLRTKKMSTAFVRSLLYYAELARKYREDPLDVNLPETQKLRAIEGLRYLPLLSYNLSRNIRENEIRVWAEKFKDADGDAMRHLRFIANYCLNLNRG